MNMPSRATPLVSRRSQVVRLLAASAVLLSLAAAAPRGQTPPETPADQRIAALQALREGAFDKATALFQRSADGGDPMAKDYSGYAAEFDAQHEIFVAKRRKEFERSLDDVRKLVDAKSDEVAIEFAAQRTYTYAEDKQKFADSDLVRGLIERSAKMAAEREAAGDWIRAQRLYGNISILEPSEPKWKDRHNTVVRRVRILALYCPDVIKAQRDEDAKLADEIRKILPARAAEDGEGDGTTTRPTATTLPATPTTVPVPDDGTDPFKIDWHETVRDINPELLLQGLIRVRGAYWRDIDFTNVMIGGMEGIRTLVTTKGVAATFPTVADDAKRTDFLARLDAAEAKLRATSKVREPLVARETYEALLDANRETLGLPDGVVVYEFGDAALATCDPFSKIFWPSELDDFQKQFQGEFAGVGISIREDNDGILVASPLEDSPAYRAGIKAGDHITHVDGRSIRGITSEQAVKVITGQSGTTVNLTIKSPDGTVKIYPLVRTTIHVASVKGFVRRPDQSWDYFIDPSNKIAYVRLTIFSRTSAAELERATSEITGRGAKGMILDLRYNPGGLLPAAIDVVNRFVDHGLIVSTHPDRQTSTPATTTFAQTEPDGVKVPLVVLINQYSASASEIVSGALKDQGRAVIVGERSFGKGSVQEISELGRTSDKTAIKITTAHYYLPSGRCLHRDEDSKVWGVDPDVKVEMMPEQMAAAQRALNEFDVLHSPAEQADPKAATRPTMREMTDRLIKTDSQLGAALLLLRLQLHGATVAEGVKAPGVATETR